MRKFCFILFIPVLLSCSHSKAPYKIGVSQCSSGPWRDKANTEMLAAQHLYEQDMQVVIAQAYDDPQQQIRQIDSLANTGIDLLVVAPSESQTVAKAITHVREKGIPVIFFDRKATTQDYTAFIGGDNTQAGLAMGNYALSLLAPVSSLHEHPIILEITGALTTSPAQERHEGFARAMQGRKQAQYTCIKGDWSSTQAAKAVSEQLDQGICPDIIFCHNDAMCMGVYKVLEEAGVRKNVKILGIDGMPHEGLAYLQQGQIDATYVYPTHGEEIIRLALNILEHKPFSQANYLQGIVVTPDNVNIVALNSHELIHQNEQLITIHNKLENYFSLYSTQRKMLVGSLLSILLLLIAVILTWFASRKMHRANKQIKQLAQEQKDFYTHASHQLRTPLTLIAGPIIKLLGDEKTVGDTKEMLEIVNRNVVKLEEVVTGVLSFNSQKEQLGRIDDSSLKDTSTSGLTTHNTTLQESRLAMLKHEDTEELPSILVVDDNDDIRRYLRSLLGGEFYVLEANDGQTGLKVARDIVPDIVVTDVMMPVMNGLEFCRHLKSDVVTSHIPVIMLTARSSEAHQMEGYEHGADAYLTKPFHADLLIARIYNLIKSRQQLRSVFGVKDVEPSEDLPSNLSPLTSHHSPLTTHPSQDKLFAEQLKEAIKEKMSDPNLKMDDLGQQLGISRVQLYRKVKALTGLSPVELLRQMRLQHAYTLIATTTKTISEIAFEVGFNTPGYFSKCFREQYGKYPTDLRS